MPNTTNFNWTTPADTDYVKDGALAIRTLANGIDTSLIDLKGGTTGQILSKNSNTDLDYTWINNDQGDITNVAVTSPITGGGSSGSVTIGIDDGTTAQKGAVQLEDSTSSTSTTKAATPNSVKSAYDLANGAIAKSLVDAKGDLIAATADNTVARLAVGTNCYTLVAASGESTGLKWGLGSAFHGASVYNTAVQSVSNSTFTHITFDSEYYDTDGFHSTSSNTARFTIPANFGGYYRLTAKLFFATNGTGSRLGIFYKNGTTAGDQIKGSYLEQGAYANANNMLHWTWVGELAAGDFVTAAIWQDSGGSLNTANTDYAFYAIEYIGAA